MPEITDIGNDRVSVKADLRLYPQPSQIVSDCTGCVFDRMNACPEDCDGKLRCIINGVDFIWVEV
jgi:hypothetical protein